MHLLVTRPEPDASELKVQLEALGHEATVAPLLRIDLFPVEATAFEGAQAIVATSRNGLRALAASGPPAEALRLPLFAVGPDTARLAREMGFARIFAGSGSASDLVPLIKSEAQTAAGPIVHVAGEKLAFDLAAALEGCGLEVHTLVAYRSHAERSFTPETARMIADGAIDAVILMSRRTATTFGDAVAAGRLEDSIRRLTCLCISQAVAQELQALAPGRVEVAAKSNSAEMLALVTRVATQSSRV